MGYEEDVATVSSLVSRCSERIAEEEELQKPGGPNS
jgi:hypothetical protein